MRKTDLPHPNLLQPRFTPAVLIPQNRTYQFKSKTYESSHRFTVNPDLLPEMHSFPLI